MRFAVMIEGQEGVGWDDWLALAETCERTGIEALFRSDHYLSVEQGQDLGALDAWGTICGLAAVTEKLRLGTLVSPATFRHPSNLAKLAVTADHISGGRVELGLGTGWHDAEHRAYGFPDPSFGRLAEQVAVAHGILSPGPFSFSGEHYELEELEAQPEPVQSPIPLILGGAAKKRGAALAARYAAEYNVVHATPEEAGAARGRVRAACEAAGRDPDGITFSLMHGLALGADAAQAEDRARRLGGAEGWLRGTPEQVVERLREYEAVGVERVFVQHLLFRELDVIELLAAEVVPALS
jgi:alkanesulfonate monooxygenase SsuD/methylene tetrahydromethanopterin reductase-like flavin-dependent oxidoreductase (luciferase family)